MNENKYQAPASQIIYFLETDLISTSNDNLGEWDTEM